MLEVNTITDDRQMRALTGLDLATFCALAEPFAAGCQAEADARFSVEQPRQRRAGGGRKGPLVSSEQKLLFMLFYLKTCPTFDVLGATFGLSRSRTCERAHHLAKALERTFRALDVLPARAIDSLAQMQAVFADVPVRLLDATERHRTPLPPGAGRRRPAGQLLGQKKGPPVKTRSSPTRPGTSTTWGRPPAGRPTTTKC